MILFLIELALGLVPGTVFGIWAGWNLHRRFAPRKTTWVSALKFSNTKSVRHARTGAGIRAVAYAPTPPRLRLSAADQNVEIEYDVVSTLTNLGYSEREARLSARKAFVETGGADFDGTLRIALHSMPKKLCRLEDLAA